VSDEMHFRIEVRHRTDWSPEEVRNSNADDVTNRIWRQKLMKDVLRERSEADRARDAKIGMAILTPPEREELDQRALKDGIAPDRVRIYVDNMRSEAVALLRAEIDRLRERHPGFDGIANSSLDVQAHAGSTLASGDDFGALMARTSPVRRVLQSFGLQGKPRYDVVEPYLSIEAHFKMKGDEQTLNAVASELRQAYQSLGVVHELEARLLPARPMMPVVAPLEERLAARTPLPSVGAEAIGLIGAVEQALQAGDTPGAFDAAEAFADLVRRSNALNTVLGGTDHAHMGERFGKAGSDVASQLPRIIANLRASNDATDLEALFFKQHPDHRGVMPLLRQVTDDRRANTQPSRGIGSAFEEAFGQPENMLMHLIAFDHPDRDPLSKDRSSQAPSLPPKGDVPGPGPR